MMTVIMAMLRMRTVEPKDNDEYKDDDEMVENGDDNSDGDEDNKFFLHMPDVKKGMTTCNTYFTVYSEICVASQQK